MIYQEQFTTAKIQLLEQMGKAKAHHRVQCLECSHVWSTTPRSIIQSIQKYGTNSCPMCNKRRIEERAAPKRQASIQKLIDRGLEILSDWNGGTVGSVTVRNTNCNHTFTSTAKNLLSCGVECPTCARMYKTTTLNASSETRSNAWRQTASAWKVYRSKVTSLTRIVYRNNKHMINPLDLPFGLAGTEGAYHLDHKVSVRYCFDNDIPAEWCAQQSNLQMLPWLENVQKRDKLIVSQG